MTREHHILTFESAVGHLDANLYLRRTLRAVRALGQRGSRIVPVLSVVRCRRGRFGQPGLGAGTANKENRRIHGNGITLVSFRAR